MDRDSAFDNDEFDPPIFTRNTAAIFSENPWNSTRSTALYKTLQAPTMDLLNPNLTQLVETNFPVNGGIL